MAPARGPVSPTFLGVLMRFAHSRRGFVAARSPVVSCSALLLPLLAAVGGVFGPGDLCAQDEYVHFEPGQVQPITVARIVSGEASRRVLLVCNTPDDCVEIYDAESPFAFLQRVPTGLTPVTVRYFPDQQAFYSCNFLGDSVTKVTFRTSTSGGLVQFTALVDRTVFVGDEPCDIVFDTVANQAFVSLHGRSGAAVLDATDLSTLTPLALASVEDAYGPNLDAVLKHPTQMQYVGTDRLYVLDRQDDDDVQGSITVDFDLLCVDATAGGALPTRLMGTGLGTTPHAFAINRAGTQMFVVGMDAQNQVAAGEANVALLQTGFVQSFLWVVDLAPGVAPATRAEWDATMPAFPSINLNRDYTAAGLVEVMKSDALAQPAGVILIEGPGGVEQIVLTTLSSDVVAFLTPNAAVPGGYTIQRMGLTPFNPTPGTVGSSGEAGYSIAGTCGITWDGDLADPSAAGQTGLLFVTGALDNSVAVISPVTMTEVARFQLQHDPTEDVIRTGREFLFSAEFSGNGTVSCSSCHIWGGTDAIAWDLGSPDGPSGPIAIHPWLLDSVPPEVVEFEEFKGELVTQTLRGLVNSTVEGPGQIMFTNAPYHWRADKDAFQNFNSAFVNLLKMIPEPGADPGNGLTNTHMNEFTAYINEIHHEPNPLQSKARIVPGDLGDLFDTLSGSGAARGLKAYHTETSVGGRACVHCHSNPEGSNNRMTETFVTASGTHPLETAAVRSVFDRESLVRLTSAFPVPGERLIVASGAGLTHSGFEPPAAASAHFSINHFCSFFVTQMPGTLTQQESLIEDITEFMRGFDSGIAPIVGLAWTMTGVAGTDNAVGNLMMGQVDEANAGLAIYMRRGLNETGWWQDLTAGTDTFRREGSNVTRPFADFIGFAASPANRVILQSVPVGSARRYAALGSDPAPLLGNAPSGVVPSPMAPATHWVDVGSLEALWDPSHPTHPLGPSGLTPSVAAIHELTQAVLDEAASVGGVDFGVAGLQHEPPRRFRVTGTDIRAGARLGIGFLTPQSTIVPVWMPIFPTNHVDESSNRIWETTVEADDLMTMGLLCGSIWTPGIVDVIRFSPPSQPLDPGTNNNFIVVVQNEDGAISPIAFNSLSVRYDR